jgi:ribosomal-protein-alanine N-acetyltransferase
VSQWQLAAINPADIDSILQIEQCSFARPWSRISFLGELSCKQAFGYRVNCRGGRGDKQLIGYLFFRIIAEELHILKIAVTPCWRCRGVASCLLDECFKLAFEMRAQVAFLEVRPSNYSAMALYHNQGFKVIGRRPNYYTDTREDALVLMKNLKEDTYDHKNWNQWFRKNRALSLQGGLESS